MLARQASGISDMVAAANTRQQMLQRNSDRACLARIPEAPVFRPTAEEFKDPMEYIRSIWVEGAGAGICKIIPPPSWYSSVGSSGFPDTMRFKTRHQEIHKLRHRHRGVADRFINFVEQWHRAQEGDSFAALVFPPVVRCRLRPAGRKADYNAHVDLYQLYMIVQRLGGVVAVNDTKAWPSVVSSLYLPAEDKNVCAMVEDIYVMYLHPLPDVDVLGSLFPELPNSKVHPSVRRIRSRTRTGTPSVEGSAEPDMKRLSGEDFCSVSLRPNAVFCNGCDKALSPMEEYDPEPTVAYATCSMCGLSYHPECFPGSRLKSTVSSDRNVPGLACSSSCGFGFSTAKKDIELRDYRAQSNDVKRRWLKQMRSARDGTASRGAIAWQDIEHEYWNIVEDPARAVYVQYGSDLDTKVTASGFPSPSASESEDCELNPWNLNIFPSVSGSLLKYFHDSIKGINVPWLYCGSMFSTFCYHTEDLNMMSINYMHLADEGGGKVWYGAPPGPGALGFESAMRSAAPELFAAQPDLIFQLLTMISPVELKARGAAVCRTVQRPGEFVLTFPQGFHGGFSLGYNIAEAVNFFTPECLPWMRAAVYRCHLYRKEPVFCMPQFLMTLISKIGVHADICATDVSFIVEEATKFVKMEETARHKVLARLWGRSRCLSRKDMSVAHVSRQNELCSCCRQPCFFSAVMRTRDMSVMCFECAIDGDEWLRECEEEVRAKDEDTKPHGDAPFQILLFVSLSSVESALAECHKVVERG